MTMHRFVIAIPRQTRTLTHHVVGIAVLAIWSTSDHMTLLINVNNCDIPLYYTPYLIQVDAHASYYQPSS
jgi:hypothetical protein